VFNIDKIREDFPILHQEINSHPLVYLDNAATSQKPRQVIDTINDYYMRYNANVHRGVHVLSELATEAYEKAREKVQSFINASSVKECIFTRGTTESINLVAQSFLAPRLKTGDKILITCLEHHSNIVPWQMICQKTGAQLKVIPINQNGDLILDNLDTFFTPDLKLVALNHISNAIGTINPVEKIIAAFKQYNPEIPILIDGAQAAPHAMIDVKALGCDFYAFSGHKMYGPTGIGVLWGKEHLLNAAEPYQGGGEMILKVSFEKSEYKPLPHKFEAGTPNIAGAIGLGAAIDYLNNLDREKALAHEHELLNYSRALIRDFPDITVIGKAESKAPILSFVHQTVHAHDIGTILNNTGIAVRSGHHCAMPLMDFLKLPGTIRASFAFYNTHQEVEKLIESLVQIYEVFKV